MLAIGALWAAGSLPEGRRWWSHVEYLAGDQLEGRNTGSAGHRKAAEYVATQFERSGLQPAGTASYLQPVRLKTRRLIPTESSLALVRENAVRPLVLGEDAIISVRVDPAESLEAPLVFAGYGLTIPERHIDDLAGLNLRGKIIVYLSGAPRDLPGPLAAHYQSASERSRYLRQAGVIGAVSLLNPDNLEIPWSRTAASALQMSMSLADPVLDESRGIQLHVIANPDRAETLFAASGHSFREILAAARSGKPLPRFPLNASLRALVRVERGEVESQNVAGILPGKDPVLKKQYVVLSAHLDHLGVGAPVLGDRIYNGAMDNASGIASLLDIAQSLHDSGTHLRRSLLFVAVTGEEKGLLGSKYFAHEAAHTEHMVANLNMDMFLPLFPLHSITVYGLNESDLGETARRVAASLGIGIQDDREPQRNLFIRSDQYSFIRQGIPALAFKLGYEPGSPEEQTVKKWLHERYHAPSDDLAQPVDREAAARFNTFVRTLAITVANDAQAPHWKQESFFRRFAR